MNKQDLLPPIARVLFPAIENRGTVLRLVSSRPCIFIPLQTPSMKLYDHLNTEAIPHEIDIVCHILQKPKINLGVDLAALVETLPQTAHNGSNPEEKGEDDNNSNAGAADDTPGAPGATSAYPPSLAAATDTLPVRNDCNGGNGFGAVHSTTNGVAGCPSNGGSDYYHGDGATADTDASGADVRGVPHRYEGENGTWYGQTSQKGIRGRGRGGLPFGKARGGAWLKNPKIGGDAGGVGVVGGGKGVAGGFKRPKSGVGVKRPADSRGEGRVVAGGVGFSGVGGRGLGGRGVEGGAAPAGGDLDSYAENFGGIPKEEVRPG